MDSLTVFFDENEKKINKLLIKVLYFCVGILLVLGGICVFGLLPDIDTSIVLKISFIGVIVFLLLIPILSFWRNSKVQKYILVIFVCLVNMAVACIPNMRIYVTFLLPPLLSFFYANERFTLFSSIISGVSYVVTIGVRCILEADDTFTVWSRKEYFFAFGAGGLVELFAYCFVLYFLTKTTTQLLKEIYLKRKRLDEIHHFIKDGLTHVTESKEKNVDGLSDE